MFTKTLLPDTVRAIKLVSKIPAIKNAYLAGGTALALQIGHRISVDLDFFTKEDFDEKILEQELSYYKEFKKEGTAWKTVWGKIGCTKFSIFYYKYSLLNEAINFSDIKVASLEDIAAMKIHSLGDRGTKRDFIDLYFLSKKFSLEQMLGFYDKKYGDLKEKSYHLIRSMNYFEDAKEEQMPQMVKDVDWNEVKKYFQTQSFMLSKKYLES